MPVSANDSGGTYSGGIPTYDKEIKPLFLKRCASCHNDSSTTPNWLDYSIALRGKDKIYQKIFIDKSMPKAPYTMLDSERAMVAAWVQAGAPKSDQGTGTQNGGPTTIPQGPCEPNLVPQLFTAVAAGDFDTASDLILTKNACLTQKDSIGHSLLMATIINYQGVGGAGGGYTKIAQLLVDKGFDVNEQFDGGSALIWAEYSDARDIAQILIDHGADVNARAQKMPDQNFSDVDGYTALMLAARNSSAAEAMALLTNGADIAVKLAAGTTARSVAEDRDDGPKKDALIGLLDQYGKGGAYFGGPSYQRDVLPILKNRCEKCHNSESPRVNWMDFKTAYKYSSLILVRVAVTKDMPGGNNETGMTDEERVKVGEWVRKGANR